MSSFWRAVGLSMAATAGCAGALSGPRDGHGAALPLLVHDDVYSDSATTTSWEGPPLDDGTPTRLYSLSLQRVWQNETMSAEMTAAVDMKKAARRDWQSRRSLHFTMEDTPLFPGWGTHFAYVYAGTPPQRVSVIVDTGSHFTAFPCSECRNCGSHTDPYWESTKSSSSHIVTCKQCHGSFRCLKHKKRKLEHLAFPAETCTFLYRCYNCWTKPGRGRKGASM